MTEAEAETPWWQTAVIYQVAVPLFTDSDGDGVGDLQGVIDRLDHLTDLGVDALWLSPIHPSPFIDMGYDVSDYNDVHPDLGDLGVLDRLVSTAHDRGLRVLLDWVPNHTSDRHPWFEAAASSRDDPKRDWYVFRDPSDNGGPPNNWRSLFGGPSWTWHEPTGQFYLHSFLDCQPDVNWRNDDLRSEMLDVLRFWLDRGVDGFRIDVAHFVMKDPQLRDNPLADEGQYHKDLGAWGELDHVHDQGHEDVHGVFRDIRAITDEYDHDPVTVGEIHEFDLERWAGYFGDGDELHMPFNFVLLDADWHGRSLADAIRSTQEALPDFAWPCWALGNHDEQRIAERYGRAQARVAMTLLLTLRGTPSIYAGDELGFTDREVPQNRRRDPWGEQREDLSRDPVRIPMAWTADDHGGFSEADADEWFLPPAPWAAERSVEAQCDDDSSMLRLVRSVLACRNAHPALRLGAATLLDDVPDTVVGLVRRHGDDQVLVLANTANDEATVEVDLPLGDVLVSTVEGAPSIDGAASLDDTGSTDRTAVRLRPDEAVIIAIDTP